MQSRTFMPWRTCTQYSFIEQNCSHLVLLLLLSCSEGPVIIIIEEVVISNEELWEGALLAQIHPHTVRGIMKYEIGFVLEYLSTVRSVGKFVSGRQRQIS